jgi:hypothetical protein
MEILREATVKRHKHTALVLLLGIGVGAMLTLVPSRRLAQDGRLPAPIALSAAARGVLTARMARHAEELDELHRSIILLAYERAAASADRILAEPALPQATGGDAAPLDAALPMRFFVLQSELRASAREVGESARRRDPDALSRAHGRLASSCAACHGVYLGGQPIGRAQPPTH